MTALPFKTHQGNNEWRTGTVSLILGNETYTGVQYYNRRKRQGPNEIVLRPQEEWIAVSVPAIVDRETFEAAQRQLAHNRKMKRKRARHKYLLRGMLTCAECGYAYCGESKHGRYRYYRHSRMGEHYAETLPASLVEETVWGAVKEVLLNPSMLWEGYRAREVEVMEQKTRLIERLEAILNLKTKAETKLEALTNAYLDPDIGMPKAEYTRRRRDIEKEITDWEREAQEIQGRLETEAITQERMQAIEEFAAEVAQGIELVGFEDKRKVLTMLQVSGKVYAGDEEPWIELEGLFPPTQVGLSSTTSRCN
jgi:site-specific DNA recombinase